MKILWITLLALSPAILYGIALLVVAQYRGRCPRCRRHGLRRVGGYLWDGRTEQGQPCGGSVSFFLCQCCSTRLRRAGRDWSDASEDDWRRHVPTRPPGKLDAQVIDTQLCSPFQFLASLLRRCGGLVANPALPRTAVGRRGCHRHAPAPARKDPPSLSLARSLASLPSPQAEGNPYGRR